MISGHNINVRHGNRVFHVQTEDKGRHNPLIETLVYTGGRIIHQEKSRYEDINGDNYSEVLVGERLDAQHQRLVADIRAGRFDEESTAERKLFGDEYVSARSFDEVVLSYLEEQIEAETLSLELLEHSGFHRGHQAHIRVRARNSKTGRPLTGADVKLRIIATEQLGHGYAVTAQTDAQGEAKLEFEVPETDGQAAAIVEATSPEGGDELTLLIS